MQILYPSPIITGQQKKKAEAAYRLMHYVVKQEVEEGVLLYNTLTCALALVTHEEAQHLVEVDGLVENWFLVPVEHNDMKLCKMLKVGLKLKQQTPEGIGNYTIVTTTGCNARCAYCFEKGTKPVNMTSETAEQVAQYIVSHRGEHEKVKISWFGGEPLYNFKVMDRICTRLTEQNVRFYSSIITNGYLFNEKMVEKAVQLWHLKRAQVTLDGTEQNYNRIKAFVHRNEQSPFQRVLANIGLLIKQGIKVSVRLNICNDNAKDMEELIKLLAERFKDQKLFSINIHRLFEQFGPEAESLSSEKRAELFREIRRLEDYGYQLGVLKPKKLNQKLRLSNCKVDNENSVMILPDGHLGLCEHYIDSRFIGHIDDEEWNQEEVKKQREYRKEIPECDTCALYPTCHRLKICDEHEICYPEEREYQITTIQRQMRNDYRRLKHEKNNQST